MNHILKRLKYTQYASEKIRFLLFALLLFLVFFLARYLLGMAYARYEVRTKINANISKALYIFEDEKISFNLEPDGIIPSDDPYVYKFSVSNFNASHDSDVDLSYTISLRTTTNLPITVKMYRNELYTAAGATNIFGGGQIKRDEDNAWYRVYSSNQEYTMNYDTHVTDVYSIVINFPSGYASDLTYENSIESIEITIDSKQII